MTTDGQPRHKPSKESLAGEFQSSFCVLLQGEAGKLESWVRLFLAGWLGDDGASSTHAACSSTGQNIPTWVISFHFSNGLNK